jgi:hypothetical protein
LGKKWGKMHLNATRALEILVHAKSPFNSRIEIVSRRRSLASSCKVNSSPIHPAGAKYESINIRDKQIKTKTKRQAKEKLTSESSVLSVETIHYGVFVLDLLGLFLV